MENQLKTAIALFLILTSFKCHLYSQELKALEPKDFKFWYDFNIRDYSPDGNWFEMSKTYGSGQDTIEIRSIKNDKRYIFSNIRSTTLDNHHFIYIINSEVQSLDFKTGHTKSFKGYGSYEYLRDQQILIIRSSTKPMNLKILNLKSNEEYVVTAVDLYKMSPDQKRMVFSKVEKDSIHISFYDFEKKSYYQSPISFPSKTALSNFIWSPDSKNIAFLLSDTSNKPNQAIIAYGLKNKTVSKFDPSSWDKFPKGEKILRYMIHKPFRFSESGKQLFFSTRPKENRRVSWDSVVEVWHSRDIIENLNLRVRDDLLNYPKYYVWNIEKKNYKQLTDDTYTDLFFNEDDTKAFLYTNQTERPNLKIEPDIDIKVLNLDSGKVIKQIEHLEYKTTNIEVSPKGKYFHYFKDLKWILVNLETGEETNLSELLEVPLYDTAYSWSGTPPPFGIAGYSSDEDELLIYSAHDIWRVNLKTLKKIRLTQGQESGRIFRITKSSKVEHYTQNTAPTIDIKKPILIKAQDSLYHSGLYYYNKNKLKKIEYKNAHLYNAKISDGQVIYTEESQNLPPRVMYWNKHLKTPKELFQSNPQHFNFQWGKAELLAYVNPETKKHTHGALFYPFGYKPGKKYPLVVNVYENQAYEINRYSKPSIRNNSGFNISLLRSQGYFVLSPNLNYKLNHVGFSINESLNKILDKIVAVKSIDKDKIGLMGYSFGGYETNYIISHNNRFAAAVSGGSVSDLVRSYTTTGKFGGPKFFQFENYQSRMTGPYFELKDEYASNSPILNVQDVNTPILIFAGKDDHHVNWSESVAFYLGLKRADKDAVLLLYPDEGHVFTHIKSQKDITQRTLDWFGHFLMGQSKPKWMTANSYDFD